MSDACAAALDAGVIRGVVSAVDCRARDFAEMGYQSLAGSALFQTALTVLLTLYIAALGYRLLFASEGVRLSDAPGVALKVGVVLTLAANWAVFQTLVFNMASAAPVEIADLLAAPLKARGATLAADPLTGLQSLYDQLNAAAAAFGKVAPAVAKPYSSGEAAAGQALTDAAGGLFATTAGLISVATIAVGVLTAAGPIFVTLLLFRQTRGLFEGWVRAMAAVALAPIGAWVLIVMMLTVVEPWIDALGRQIASGVLDVRAAMTVSAIVFVFCAAQVALLVGAVVIAMGYRWVGRTPRAAEATGTPAGVEAAAAVEVATRAQRLALVVGRLESAGAAVRPSLLPGTVMQTAGRRGGETPAASPTDPAWSYRRPSVRARRTGSAA